MDLTACSECSRRNFIKASLIVVTPFGAIGSAGCVARTDEGVTEYYNETYGYTLTYPAGWTVLEESTPEDLLIVESTASPIQSAIGVSALSPTFTVDTVLTAAVLGLYSDAADEQSLELRDTTPYALRNGLTGETATIRLETANNGTAWFKIMTVPTSAALFVLYSYAADSVYSDELKQHLSTTFESFAVPSPSDTNASRTIVLQTTNDNRIKGKVTYSNSKLAFDPHELCAIRHTQAAAVQDQIDGLSDVITSLEQTYDNQDPGAEPTNIGEAFEYSQQQYDAGQTFLRQWQPLMDQRTMMRRQQALLSQDARSCDQDGPVKILEFTRDMARLSRYMYNYRTDESDQEPLPAGWEEVDITEEYGITVESKRDLGVKVIRNAESGMTTIVFEGTDPKNLKHWTDNVSQGGFGHSDLYMEAMRIGEQLVTKIYEQDPTTTIVTTGHSLGGALADALSRITGIRAITFDAAGVNDKTLTNYFASTDRGAVPELLTTDEFRHSQVDAWRSTEDILTRLQESTVGQKIMPTASGTQFGVTSQRERTGLERLPIIGTVMYRVREHDPRIIIDGLTNVIEDHVSAGPTDDPRGTAFEYRFMPFDERFTVAPVEDGGNASGP